MAILTPRDIGSKLKQAGRLSSQPLCIYGTDTPPAESISSTEINRCIARVIFTLATDSTHSGVYISVDKKKKCCPGGQAWLGFQPFMPYLKHFLSSGSPDFRNGSAEYLISDPDLVEKRLKSIGKVTPLDEFIIIQRSDQIFEQHQQIKAFLCFGEAEQIRNLCSLIYFRSEKSSGIQIPWGPSCASFISYPTGMIKFNQQECAILGPTDPTGNFWFPHSFMSMGVPFNIARQMAEDLDSSFIIQRPKVAYPVRKS
ncbi:MAG: DUF169 domain-containing protein [Candidatus Heimdallarchaeota archaeon]|nr:MAG: DUF169 domain-containing protein [Candidatus Heimdallarchaeota archaeon]